MKLPRFFVGKNNTDKCRVPLNVPEENVLSLRKKDDFKIEINFTQIRDFLKKNKKLATPVSILIVVLIVFSIAIKGKASIVNFYPETCLGGWENPSNVSGQPSVASEAQGSDFTRDNSAFLKNRTAQVFCGDFGGEVPKDSTPRKFTVRFSWFVDDGSYDKGEKIINEALDEGRNVQTQTAENEDTDLGNQESGENVEDTSGSDTDSSADESADDSSIPSNEGGSSDLPSGEMAQENDSTNEDSSAPSSSDDSGSESSSSNDSSGSEGGSSEGASDSSPSDGGGGSGDSSGSDSSGGDGAFFERFITKVFAQEAESPTPQSEQQIESTPEEVSEPSKEENTSEESSEISAEAPLEEITQPVEVEVQSENGEATEIENLPESNNEPNPTEENTELDKEEFESNGIVSLDETARDDLFKVMYTLDGTTWEDLGIVKRNNWKNVEFDIPFSSVDSWEKLSKVQIAIESLLTIDAFPETYLDSVWIAVEYEGVNPDPLPQPDFLKDKVLNDIRYENVRVIKILKPDGEYQIWYAFVPPSLLATVDGAVGSDEIIKSGDSSLQIIDASTIPDYDPLIGPLPQVTETPEENSTLENPDPTSEETTGIKEEVLGESIAEVVEIKNTEESVLKEETQAEIKAEEKIDTTKDEIEAKEIKPFENVLEFVTGNDREEHPSETPEPQNVGEESENVVLNEEIIKEEGDPVDLRELNQPEWRWDLVARGKEVHPEYDIAVDNFKLFWITQTGDSFNMFGLDSSGTYSGVYFGQGEQVGVMTFITPTGTARFARFNRDTKKFMFSDE